MARSGIEMSRRDWLRHGGAWALASATAEALWAPMALGAPPPEREPLNRFPRMVQEWFVNQLRAIEGARLRAFDALQTRADAEAHVASVRERIARCFGPFPEKTPLNPKITGTVDRDTYRIEKVLFESRPGFLVSANLYVPKGRTFPVPGVVGSCGHSENGKAAAPYQSFAQGLARQGYVVLIFDPIGQGERLQYLRDDLTSRVGAGVREHLLCGNQQVLVGESLATWRAWDGIRALDYLLTREEVDPKHVGITGNSGGGTMTTWLCGVEPRWSMAAPSCFVTMFRRNLENELPADIEQCPPRALALGLDHEDFLAAIAPKPLIILGKERDYFDVRGTEAAYRRLKRLYGLLGAEENIGLFVGPTPHGYSQENREAMYGWFNRATGLSTTCDEPALKLEKDEALQCTPRGQVGALGSRTVFSFTAETARALGEKRAALKSEDLPKVLVESLGLRGREASPEYRILRPPSGRGYPKRNAGLYAVETEPGSFALVTRLYDGAHVSRPPRAEGRAILYVAHHSADAELRSEPLVRALIEAEPNAAFYACDTRGIGESRPETCGVNTFTHPYGCDYFYAAHSLMLGRSYPSQKTHDVLTTLDWLRSLGHADVHLAALGWGTVPATFAAVLSDLVTRVTLKQAPKSYTEIAESEEYDWPLSTLPPGALRQFDLTHCYAFLEGKELRQVEPRGAKA